MNIKSIMNSGQVVRFHNHVGIDKQNLAEHQWGVAMIVQYIEPSCSKELLLAALTHDAAEYYTGDIPFPTKQVSHTIKTELDVMERMWIKENGLLYIFDTLNSRELVVLKVADILEGMWYCTLQMKCGRKAAARPFRKWNDALLGLREGYKVSSKAEELYELILAEKEKWS